MLQWRIARSAATPAKHGPRISAAVDQNKNLRLKQQALVNPRVQHLRNRAGLVGLLKVLAQIDKLHRSQRTILHPLGPG